ncbi:MAG TPA: alpha/beta hydrolase [Steroidobacteraceae bacterium]|jgi:pimeloyl-ACP methyl ester carboxylesterase|nr:alpha/beta hydrolase [Steroidobacteraceae bacterium]
MSLLSGLAVSILGLRHRFCLNCRITIRSSWREPIADSVLPTMTPIAPSFRESGAGPGVICLHANASSSSQWRSLMEMLAPTYRVFAADSYGAGKSPPYVDGVIRLGHEVALLEPIFARAGRPFSLVGHSYGGAVALIAAMRQPHKVKALAVYEPTLFSLVDAESPAPNEVDGIRNAVAQAGAALDAGDRDSAARYFIDFWMGAGAWDKTPEQRKGPITAAIANVVGWGDALFKEPTPLEAFATLDVPVLYMIGGRSPPSSRSVARLLTQVLPQVEVVEFEKLGHMGPVTHPNVVNEAISQFLSRQLTERRSFASSRPASAL